MAQTGPIYDYHSTNLECIGIKGEWTVERENGYFDLVTTEPYTIIIIDAKCGDLFKCAVW